MGNHYSEQELREIRKVCDEYEMYLFADGARLGYGLGSVKNDLTLAKNGRTDGCILHWRDQVRRFIWRGTGDHKQEAGAEVPYLYETERSRSGKRMASWDAVLCPVRG